MANYRLPHCKPHFQIVCAEGGGGRGRTSECGEAGEKRGAQSQRICECDADVQISKACRFQLFSSRDGILGEKVGGWICACVKRRKERDGEIDG